MSSLRCPRCGTGYDAPARFCMKDGFPLIADGGESVVRPSPSRRASNLRLERPTASEPASALQGRIIDGRYAIERRVGEGGVAYVSSGVHREAKQAPASA